MKSKTEKVQGTLDKPVKTTIRRQLLTSKLVENKRRKPSLKQQLALNHLVGNGGNVTKAMLAAGYSPATANTPQKLTGSSTFQELLDELLPERHLTEKHREFLDSERIIRRFKKGELEEEISETDPNAVKALDMAYKLRGKYADKAGNNILIINVSSQAADRYKAMNNEHADVQDVSTNHE